MQVGMVGLGRMGSNLVRRLLPAGHECVVFDVNPRQVKELEAEGATGSGSLGELVERLDKPRAVWVMVPAGEIAEQTVRELGERLEPGDVIIDGGNSYYRDDIARATALGEKKIHYLDVGTSGGVWGLERGYCLMIGGETVVVERLGPLFEAIAPGVETAPRTAGRRGRPASAERGYLHCGPAGAGHFVKMIHNGIEYGVMAAYASRVLPIRDRHRVGGRGVAAWQRDRLLAPRLDRGSPPRLARSARVLGPRVGLRRGPLDGNRCDRGECSGPRLADRAGLPF